MQLHKEDGDQPSSGLDKTSSKCRVESGYHFFEHTFQTTHKVNSERHITRSETYLETTRISSNTMRPRDEPFVSECFHLSLQKSTPCLNHLYNEQKKIYSEEEQIYAFSIRSLQRQYHKASKIKSPPHCVKCHFYELAAASVERYYRYRAESVSLLS